MVLGAEYNQWLEIAFACERVHFSKGLKALSSFPLHSY